MRNHWTTQDEMREAIVRGYMVSEESFASPLNCLMMEGVEYCSAHPRDVVFGARYDAYKQPRKGMSAYMNPEYVNEELDKALRWAIAASQGGHPFCAVLVYPRFKMATYMELLAHRNVGLIAEFDRHSFAFKTPDHWQSSGEGTGAGTAKWPVMVIEVSNEAGRARFKSVNAETDIIGAAVDAGAVLTTAEDRAFDTDPDMWLSQPRGFARVQAGRPPPPAQGKYSLEGREGEVKARGARELQTEGWDTVAFTDGSMIQEEVGAGYVVPEEDITVLMKVMGPQTVNRAELTAIYAVLQDMAPSKDLVVYTDSKVAIQKLAAWAANPETLVGDKHESLVAAMGGLIAGRPGRFALRKIKAHVGLQGNELADEAAKRAALEGEGELNVRRGMEGSGVLGVGLPSCEGEPLTKPKTQLRPVVREWMRRRYKYGTLLHDMWAENSDGIDMGPSNRHWKVGAPLRRPAVKTIFRMRNGDYVCQYLLHKHAKNPDAVDPSCPLGCPYIDTWRHTFLCEKSGVKDLVTARHNRACEIVEAAMRQNGHQAWMILRNYGKVDGGPEEKTVPPWMLGRELRGRQVPDKPDFVVIKGWRRTWPPPEGPVTHARDVDEGTVSVSLVLGELKYADDTEMPRKHEMAREKYAPLIEQLAEAGWRVNDRLATVVIGHRACVSKENPDSFTILGIQTKRKHTELQEKLAKSAAEWAGYIVAHTRRYRARHGGGGSAIGEGGPDAGGRDQRIGDRGVPP